MTTRTCIHAFLTAFSGSHDWVSSFPQLRKKVVWEGLGTRLTTSLLSGCQVVRTALRYEWKLQVHCSLDRQETHAGFICYLRGVAQCASMLASFPVLPTPAFISCSRGDKSWGGKDWERA